MTAGESEEPTACIPTARSRVIAFVRKTGIPTFTHKNVNVNPGTLKRLAGMGFIVYSTSEKDKENVCNVYKLADRELNKIRRLEPKTL